MPRRSSVIRRIEVWASLLLFVLVLLCAPQAHAKTVNEIVAVVNGEAVTRYELRNEMQASPAATPLGRSGLRMESETDREQRILRRMINRKLFVQEADKLGISVSDDVVRSRLERIREENGLSREELVQQLKKRGLDLEQFKETIRRKIKINRLFSSMVRQKVVLTEEEIRGYYEDNRDEFLPPSQISLSLILMRDGQKLRALRARIRRDRISFSRAAQHYSIGPNAKQGGSMGTVAFKDLNRKLKERVRDLEPGRMSPVFSFKDGYALVRVEEKHASRGEEAFSSVRDKVRRQLYRRKVRQRYKEYVDKLRSKAVIDIRL
jgi:peptidyl-prolyl cis-trans isomerase SurA